MTAISEDRNDDDRLIRESGIEARVAAIIIPVLGAIGYRLVRVRMTAQDGATLQIMAERPDGTMTVEDCEEVSRALSPVLDVEDPIDTAYQLEISSPGIDRPLVRKEDFASGEGHLVKIETSILLDGRKRFRGFIVENDEETVTIEPETVEEDGDEDVLFGIPFEAIAEARLVLTDDLVRDALKQEKEERRERKRNRRPSASERAAQRSAKQDATEPAGDEEPGTHAEGE
ncbi:ribosome maturation factor RimP [Nitratireductor aquimarinus]|uniref:ribosome maturation factor RimP n=1 Tax=Alphaproteobacteria TaxID=28211 RepID=UPI0019D362D1|nr:MULTISPECIES: ribosome maturation factor RimP [Alphaproteobacteria]MBY6023336.1 ribosome maturation factor RimP [Nitratireductor sp. DP7N14-4]MBN7758542.1 ribosome maturation factor RimP [Nitratireductor aquimarinus]MBN7761467.1 ribosome maturation factor RimP [Nitratireductor aquibiodomus]MBN8243395.1 ribosome maturation factor RimP [Nitratireductor aquimarinus]MBY6001304.1 ribosome maturation factor RimP [Tritonibacter mobilis]